MVALCLFSVALIACGPSPEANCDNTVTCGANDCVDTQTDISNCGGCGIVCGASQVCSAGVCGIDTGSCDPGDSEECYTGQPGTDGVGECKTGTRTCSASGTWGGCDGEVVPMGEICGNSVDDNCNGSVDEDTDTDGDGVTTCGGDCCDTVNDGCGDPSLVNPGSFEVNGNQVDDDCDGIVDNAVANCDTGLPSNSSDALEYAAAMDLCQQASGDSWGVVSARLVLPDGTGTPNPTSRSIRPDFGQTMVQSGSSMVVMSTGHAADANDTNPAFAPFEGGEDMATTSGPPADWLAANGGSFPNAASCPGALDTVANDAVMLELQIKVPTNAKSFSFSSNFFSAEYPEWVCTEFNDFFVALLDSTYAGDPANPTDKNLARYTDPAMVDYPVGVNLAHGDTGLFQVCINGVTGCLGSQTGTSTTCQEPPSELSNTGFDQINGTGCAGSTLDGGGTGWLQTSGNVVGGETITLRIAIWDTSDHVYDSLVLIDNFRWSVDSSDPGTIIVD